MCVWRLGGGVVGGGVGAGVGGWRVEEILGKVFYFANL